MSNHLLSVTKPSTESGTSPLFNPYWPIVLSFKHLISFPKLTLFIIGPLLWTNSTTLVSCLVHSSEHHGSLTWAAEESKSKTKEWKGCNRRKKDAERKKTRARAKFTLTLFRLLSPTLQCRWIGKLKKRVRAVRAEMQSFKTERDQINFPGRLLSPLWRISRYLRTIGKSSKRTAALWESLLTTKYLSLKKPSKK